MGFLGRHPAFVPAVLGGAILAVIELVALVSPARWEGPAVIAAASIAFIAAFVRWPKPTLLVFAVFVLFDHTLGRWLSPDVRHIDEIVVPFLFAITAWRTKPWRNGLIEPLRDGMLVLLFVVGTVASIVNGVPLTVWPLGLFLLAKVFAFLYIVQWHDFSAADVRQLYPLVLGIGIVVLALAPFELLDPVRFREILNLSSISVPREGLPSIKSLFYFPVLFGWFTCFVALFVFAGYVVYRRWWLLVAGVLFSIGTVLASRRRAIAGLAIALFAGFARSAAPAGGGRVKRAALAWWPVGAGTALVALAFLPALLGLVQLTVTETSSGPTPDDTPARVALYETSVAIARDHFPLGVGFGRYGSGVSRIQYSPVYAEYGLDRIDGLSPQRPNFITDTFWPRILGETGIMGLVMLLAWTALLVRDIWRASRADYPDAIVNAFVIGTWMVLIQALVETLASSMFDSPPRVYLLFGAAGMALALARGRGRAVGAPEDAAVGAPYSSAL